MLQFILPISKHICYLPISKHKLYPYPNNHVHYSFTKSVMLPLPKHSSYFFIQTPMYITHNHTQTCMLLIPIPKHPYSLPIPKHPCSYSLQIIFKFFSDYLTLNINVISNNKNTFINFYHDLKTH